ncbi:MAG: hypothetical protein LBB51_05675 [Zoogloeaceae bacterium]|nr:hypothetical protein [Zoogloeaceae bacterium]
MYQPGLSGSFLFDDESNILTNPTLPLKSLDFVGLNAVAHSGHAGPLGRPLSLLSFTLNHYFSASFDPYSMKLTNLVIHLVNTLLVGGLAWVALLALARKERNQWKAAPLSPALGALVAAALWGAHPLNLTSVLYVVQRMTSLSALFGFAALLVYGVWRLADVRKTPLRHGMVGIAVLVLFTASALSKESGLLFLPLLLFMELTLFQGPSNGRASGEQRWRRTCQGIFVLGVLVALWKLPDFVHPGNFLNRDFSAWERVMTESRVLFYYLRLFFFPSLAELTLYHDDFRISTGLLQPVTTLFSFAGLALVTVICWRLRKKCLPLWFAWGWFLLSHALESTVISLELVHEHRNYFATFGFVILLPWLIGQLSSKIRRHAQMGFVLFFVLCAFITWQRSIVWGTPLEHAMFEASNHPHSERARYQLGFAYTQLYRATNNKEFLKSAIEEMRASVQTGHASNSALFALLHLAWRADEPVDPQVLSRLRKNLREKPAYNSNATFLANLADCQMKAACRFQPEEIVALFQAAIENPRTANDARAVMLAKLSTYYLAEFHDVEKTEATLRRALALDEDANYHLLFVELDLILGKLQDARQHLDAAVRLNGRQRWSERIARFQKALDEAEAAAKKAKAP